MLGSPQLTPEGLWKINKLYHTPGNSRIFLCSPGAAQNLCSAYEEERLTHFIQIYYYYSTLRFTDSASATRYYSWR